MNSNFKYYKRRTKHYTVAVAYFTEPGGQWKGELLWEHKETFFFLFCFFSFFFLEHSENGINFDISSTLFRACLAILCSNIGTH